MWIEQLPFSLVLPKIRYTPHVGSKVLQWVTTSTIRPYFPYYHSLKKPQRTFKVSLKFKINLLSQPFNSPSPLSLSRSFFIFHEIIISGEEWTNEKLKEKRRDKFTYNGGRPACKSWHRTWCRPHMDFIPTDFHQCWIVTFHHLSTFIDCVIFCCDRNITWIFPCICHAYVSQIEWAIGLEKYSRHVIVTNIHQNSLSLERVIKHWIVQLSHNFIFH